MGEVTMPRLSDTMSEGTVGRWLKKPGDQVSSGEIIAEIETDKATMELESFESGTLQKIVIPEGQTVPIGEVIAFIGDGAVEPAPTPGAAPAPSNARADGPGPDAPPTEEGGDNANRRVQDDQGSAQVETAGQGDAPVPGGDQGPASAPNPTAGEGTAAGYGYSAAAATANATPATGADDNGRVVASPVARRIADELGVDLRQIQGTGPGGRIIKENVEEFAAQQKAAGKAPAPAPAAPAPAPAAPAPAPAAAKPAAPAPTLAGAEALGRMRKAIARAMTDSKPGVPHIYVTTEVDMDAAMALREQLAASGIKVSVNDLVVKAAAKALVAVPAVNSSYSLTADGQPGVVRHQQINVSVAVALEDGLTAPVIRDADKKSVGAISAEIRDMAGRAREGKIKQNELEGATFQVSNLGMFGVTEFVSIITAPQAASIAVGAVRKVPVVKDDQVVVGQVMNITISADHRIVDGAVAAQFLQELKKLLEAPMSVLV
jgi:pyruvate dehydrogenase E2 component (dihydrolipoamide acetyltransferase)